MTFPVLTLEERLKRLTPPTGNIHVVIDSDTYNEVDDQFAIAYALLSGERMTVEAVYAAPLFFRVFCETAELHRKGTTHDQQPCRRHGTKLSGNSSTATVAGHIARRPGVSRLHAVHACSGAAPVESEAARDLVRRANQSDGLLYVLAIGEITNIASAILPDRSRHYPENSDRVVGWTTAITGPMPWSSTSGRTCWPRRPSSIRACRWCWCHA